MPDSTVRVVARVVARPGQAETLRAVLESLIPPTRAEAGCRHYELWRNHADPNEFTFIEEWTTDAALDAHLATEHFLAAAAQLPGVIAGEPDIRRYRLVR